MKVELSITKPLNATISLLADDIELYDVNKVRLCDTDGVLLYTRTLGRPLNVTLSTNF